MNRTITVCKDYKSFNKQFWNKQIIKNIKVLKRCVHFTYTVLGKRDRYFVLLNYTHKSCSNMKSMVIIGLCCSWGFRNTPWMLNFIKIWLRYWRSKTEDPIQNNVWDLISSDESLTKLWQILQKSDLYQFF